MRSMCVVVPSHLNITRVLSSLVASTHGSMGKLAVPTYVCMYVHRCLKQVGVNRVPVCVCVYVGASSMCVDVFFVSASM